MSKPVMSSPNFGLSTDRFLEGFQEKNQKRLLIGFSCHRPRITGWARIHPLVRPFVGRLMWAAVRATAAAAQEHADRTLCLRQERAVG